MAYNKDPSPVKLNLGVGAYRTEVSFSPAYFTYSYILLLHDGIDTKIIDPLKCHMRWFRYIFLCSY